MDLTYIYLAIAAVALACNILFLVLYIKNHKAYSHYREDLNLQTKTLTTSAQKSRLQKPQSDESATKTKEHEENTGDTDFVRESPAPFSQDTMLPNTVVNSSSVEDTALLDTK